jgi:EAL domain-containing protein (putative c-di-GMP-specific phosphodiesterase class I)
VSLFHHRRRKIDSLTHGQKLLLVYQPIVDLRTGRMVSAEALIRVKDEHGNVVAGGDMATEAEEEGSIGDLQQRIVWEAFQDAARWRAAGLTSIRLNLNVSARVLTDPEFMNVFDAKISECDFPPDHLNFEITETAFIDDPRAVRPILEGLRSRGIEIWLDDFGSGHSSLSHLQYFPVSGLKLPGLFIQEYPENRRAAAIVHHVIALAAELDAEVVAEEVERREQLDSLRAAGCGYVQGFIFSEALEMDEFVRFGGLASELDEISHHRGLPRPDADRDL